MGAHERILEDTGIAFPPESQVRGRAPFPRARHVEAIVVDDRVSLTAVPAGARKLPAVAERSFREGGKALLEAGLGVHPDKGVRNAKHAAPLGIEIDGVRGLAGAERLRRHHLNLISLGVCSQGQWSAAARRQLTSSWAFCLEARRPMLCLLDGLYRELGTVDPLVEPVVVQLSSSAASELSLLIALSPLMCADLRLPHSDVIVATDASEEGLAGCLAPVSPALHSECWRVRDRRGRPTRLEPEASGPEARRRSLRRSAYGVLDEDPDFPESGQVGPDRVLIETFDFIEVCCGPRHPLSDAMARAGLRVGPHIDVLLHPMWDLACPRLLEWLIFLISHDRVWYVHLAPPCTTFSIARKPALRSAALPAGFRRSEPRTRAGNLALLRCAALASCVRRLSKRHCTLEHPASAFSWQWPLVRAQFERVLRYDVCEFQLAALAPHLAAAKLCGDERAFADEHRIVRKRSRWGCVRAPFMDTIARTCTGCHCHTSVETAWKSPEYDRHLCAAWARAAAAARAVDPDPLAQEDLALADRSARPRLERLLYNEVAYAADWAELFVAPARDEHINVGEMRAVGRALRECAEHRPRRRQMFMVDSKVSAGAFSKGRSASKPLNEVLRAALPDILGGCITPGYGFFPTRLNPPDDLTRSRELRVRQASASPLSPFLDSRSCPSCEDLQRLHAWGDLPTQERAYSEWGRLVWLLIARAPRGIFPLASAPRGP
jgi:hypothetical protein